MVALLFLTTGAMVIFTPQKAFHSEILAFEAPCSTPFLLLKATKALTLKRVFPMRGEKQTRFLSEDSFSTFLFEVRKIESEMTF